MEQFDQYGRKNFTFEPIVFFDNEIDLGKWEKETVTNEMLQDPLCLNMKKPGLNDGGQQLNNMRPLTIKEKSYENLYQASDDTSLSIFVIRHRCESDLWKEYNWKKYFTEMC